MEFNESKKSKNKARNKISKDFIYSLNMNFHFNNISYVNFYIQYRMSIWNMNLIMFNDYIKLFPKNRIVINNLKSFFLSLEKKEFFFWNFAYYILCDINVLKT